MPTPFTHLEIAQRLLQEQTIQPHPLRRDAFIFGSIAADARIVGRPRSTTHFYDFREPMVEHPWRVMVQQNPSLLQPQDAVHWSFSAGYVAHLAVDEIWTKEMVGPHFAARDWADQEFRFYMLQIILTYMDERDLSHLEPWHVEELGQAQPHNWLPFISDEDLLQWRDFIHMQLLPEGQIQTLQVFGERLGKRPAELRAFLDSPGQMQAGLWDHIPKSLLQSIENQCYEHALTQTLRYISETFSRFTYFTIN